MVYIYTHIYIHGYRWLCNLPESQVFVGIQRPFLLQDALKRRHSNSKAINTPMNVAAHKIYHEHNATALFTARS